MKRKVVVVTGASAGIGRATIREFAKDGCALGLIARGTQGLEDAKREVEALGGTAIACRPMLPMLQPSKAQPSGSKRNLVRSTFGSTLPSPTSSPPFTN